MVREDVPGDRSARALAPTVAFESHEVFSPAAGEVTRLLSEFDQCHGQAAADQLLPLVYEELRRLAAAKMAQERPGQTLQATALVHEAYLRLAHQTIPQRWESRRQFFAAAAEAMRRILVEQARHKSGPRAGGNRRRVDLATVEPERPHPGVDVQALNEALDELAARHPRIAELVQLRYFAGLTRRQVAELLGISIATADDDWAYAKGFLRVQLGHPPPL